MQSDPNAEITRRLRCAAGHLGAVIEMAQSGQPCDQILHQLNAVQSALRAAGVKIIEYQVQCNQDIILNSTSVTARTAALHNLQSLYAIFVTQFSIKNEVNDE